jgi:hypothetical protein
VARAMVQFERQADGTWMPWIVLLATPKRLQGKALPGDDNRDARLDRYLTGAIPPRMNDNDETRGTMEDWIGWAVGDRTHDWSGALANGHTTWATEVTPTVTVDDLYQREVLDAVQTKIARR